MEVIEFILTYWWPIVGVPFFILWSLWNMSWDPLIHNVPTFWVVMLVGSVVWPITLSIILVRQFWHWATYKPTERKSDPGVYWIGPKQYYGPKPWFGPNHPENPDN